MNTITLNGVRSDTIQGLLIQSLPPISKPPMRVNVEEIDGRNGDIITDLGYQAYDKTITIGLRGEFDINDVISFFNSEGTVVFSNEPDKYYRYKIYQQIDFERLIRFRVATVTMHVQPFKYPLNETPISVSGLIWEGTDYDQTPYIFRATKDSSVEVGNREIVEQITGGTVAWNQQAPSISTFKGGSKVSSYTVSGDTATIVTDASNNNTFALAMNVPFQAHKYLVSADIKGTTIDSTARAFYALYESGATGSSGYFAYATTSWATYATIISNPSSFTGQYRIGVRNNGSAAMEYQIKNIQLFDLTQLFGTTIADYIYNLETTTAGAGVSLFKSLFPKDYYPYNAGELMSVKTSARETVGFNQWDEEWNVGNISATTGQDVTSTDRIRSRNYIRVIPERTYYFNTPSRLNMRRYGADKAYIGTASITTAMEYTVPSDTHYIRFIGIPDYGTTYNNDICINLSKTTGSPKNGDYAPYEHHTYPLSNIELRGIPKLVNNKLQYDGDIYKADGSVTRRYGIVVIDENSPIGQHAGGDTRFYIQKNDMKRRMNYLGYVICDRLQTVINYGKENENGFVSGYASDTGYIGQNWLYFSNGVATTVADIKTWLASNPLTVVYELAAPTTETTTPYTETQICSPYGTEEFIDDRDVQIPVGHKTRYEQIEPINIEITNSGNVPSMPTYRIEGSGSVDVNIDGLHAVTVDMSNINAITINSEEMNAYNDTGGFANRSVTGSYENLALPVGQNTLEIDGDGVIDLLVTNYERWL